jgi:hypothetical protein
MTRELEKRTCICKHYFWNWTGIAEFRLPGLRWDGHSEQSAFFMISAAVVVSKKIRAFLAGWCAHTLN